MLERVRAPEREERMLPREPFRVAHTMGSGQLTLSCCRVMGIKKEL
jgi:hypothetical protein